MKLSKRIEELAQISNPKHLIMEALNIDLTQLYSKLDLELSQEECDAIDMAEKAVQMRIPLSRIFHRKYFYKDLFYVSPFVLDPRPETEYIVDWVVKNLNPKSILDIGTGSGCVLLSLLREFPEAKGVGVDISKYALENARENASRLNLAPEFILSNYTDKIHDKFDLIISNPPYVKTAVEYEALFDPPIALYGEDAYEKIINSKNLAIGGSIILEVPEYSSKIIENITEKSDLRIVDIEKIGNHIIKVWMQLS